MQWTKCTLISCTAPPWTTLLFISDCLHYLSSSYSPCSICVNTIVYHGSVVSSSILSMEHGNPFHLHLVRGDRKVVVTLNNHTSPRSELQLHDSYSPDNSSACKSCAIFQVHVNVFVHPHRCGIVRVPQQHCLSEFQCHGRDMSWGVTAKLARTSNLRPHCSNVRSTAFIFM